MTVEASRRVGGGWHRLTGHPLIRLCSSIHDVVHDRLTLPESILVAELVSADNHVDLKISLEVFPGIRPLKTEGFGWEGMNSALCGWGPSPAPIA